MYKIANFEKNKNNTLRNVLIGTGALGVGGLGVKKLIKNNNSFTKSPVRKPKPYSQPINEVENLNPKTPKKTGDKLPSDSFISRTKYSPEATIKRGLRIKRRSSKSTNDEVREANRILNSPDIKNEKDNIRKLFGKKSKTVKMLDEIDNEQQKSFNENSVIANFDDNNTLKNALIGASGVGAGALSVGLGARVLRNRGKKATSSLKNNASTSKTEEPTEVEKNVESNNNTEKVINSPEFAKTLKKKINSNRIAKRQQQLKDLVDEDFSSDRISQNLKKAQDVLSSLKQQRQDFVNEGKVVGNEKGTPKLDENSRPIVTRKAFRPGTAKNNRFEDLKPDVKENFEKYPLATRTATDLQNEVLKGENSTSSRKKIINSINNIEPVDKQLINSGLPKEKFNRDQVGARYVRRKSKEYFGNPTYGKKYGSKTNFNYMLSNRLANFDDDNSNMGLGRVGAGIGVVGTGGLGVSSAKKTKKELDKLEKNIPEYSNNIKNALENFKSPEPEDLNIRNVLNVKETKNEIERFADEKPKAAANNEVLTSGQKITDYFENQAKENLTPEMKQKLSRRAGLGVAAASSFPLIATGAIAGSGIGSIISDNKDK